MIKHNWKIARELRRSLTQNSHMSFTCRGEGVPFDALLQAVRRLLRAEGMSLEELS